MPCRPRASTCSSRSGTAFARSSFATAPDEVAIQSRDLRPLDRYFPELRSASLALVPDGAILDGEIVVVGARGLDFDALQQRLHPAASRVAKLSLATPASFVAFDLLAAQGARLLDAPQVGAACTRSSRCSRRRRRRST